MTRRAACWLAASLAFACSPAASDHVAVQASALEPEIVIDAGVEHQRITGFGASSAWTAPGIGDSLADQFFSAEKGIGLSLLGMTVAAFGWLSPVQGALLQEAIDVAVVLNALRALGD